MKSDPTIELRSNLPWPFVSVRVRLADGRQTIAFWSGHVWWGESRELEVVAWEPFEIPTISAA